MPCAWLPHLATPLPWSAKERAEHYFDGLDGKDLDESIAVARRLIDNGLWRPWMVRRFLRLHRHEVGRLMHRLGPMIPPRGGPPAQAPTAA